MKPFLDEGVFHRSTHHSLQTLSNLALELLGTMSPAFSTESCHTRLSRLLGWGSGGAAVEIMFSIATYESPLVRSNWDATMSWKDRGVLCMPLSSTEPLPVPQPILALASDANIALVQNRPQLWRLVVVGHPL